jgi:hypothetical protein
LDKNHMDTSFHGPETHNVTSGAGSDEA